MLAVRKIIAPPKKFKTPVYPYIPLTEEMEQTNKDIIKFTRAIVEQREAQVARTTKVSIVLVLPYILL